MALRSILVVLLCWIVSCSAPPSPSADREEGAGAAPNETPKRCTSWVDQVQPDPRSAVGWQVLPPGVSWYFKPPRRTIASGSPTRFSLVVRNDNSESARIQLSAAGGDTGVTIAFDLLITTVEGVDVWRRLHGQESDLTIGAFSLPAHDSIELGDTWPGTDYMKRPLPPGEYCAVGYLVPEPVGVGRGVRSQGVLLNVR